MNHPADPLATARARHALQQAGLPTDLAVEQASSTRNEVLISGDFVVRVNREPNQRLRREAEVVANLPIRSWTPRVVSHGGEIGPDYLIVARRPGRPLSRVWPTLHPRDRRFAIAQLAEALDDLHRTPASVRLPRLPRSTHLLDHGLGPTLRPLWQAIGALRRTPDTDHLLLDRIERVVSERSALFERFDTTHLVHGDLTFENILWDGRQITALLDFEWCRGGPADIDIDSITRYCRYPFAHVPGDVAGEQRTEDYAGVIGWLSADLPELFDDPHLGERLLVISEDDGPAPLSVTDHLAGLGHEITLVYQSTAPSPLVGKYSNGGMLARLVDGGVQFVPMARVTSIDGDTAHLASSYGTRNWVIGPFDSIVLITGATPNDALYRDRKHRHDRVHILGDAFAPRRMVFATRQAFDLAQTLLG